MDPTVKKHVRHFGDMLVQACRLFFGGGDQIGDSLGPNTSE